MGYRHIENLYKNKSILMFKQCYACEKIHGTSAHVKYNAETKELKFFSGGSKHEQFLALFDQEKLKATFEQNHLEHPTTKSITVYGEAYGGCFAYKTPILLADGSHQTIGEIVNQKLPVEVLSYDFENQRLEPKKVVGWFKSPADPSDWLTIGFEKRLRGGRDTKLVLTKNHKVFVKSGDRVEEVLAKNLKKGDTVFLPSEKLSYVQEQLLLGSLLGDGSLKSSNLFSCSHSIKQKFYFELKEKLLNSIIAEVIPYVSGYGADCVSLRTRALPFLGSIRSLLFKGGRKSPTFEYLQKLHPIAFAFWYMDDGTLRENKLGSHRSTCHLCTDGFTEKEVDGIVSFLNDSGYYCYKIKHKKYFRVAFTPEGTIAFHSTICPYIIPEMRYKLLEDYRGFPNYWENFKSLEEKNIGLIETVVSYIKPGFGYAWSAPSLPLTKYDLEVEGNHNYFANNILVHNSMQGMSATYGKELKFIAFEVLLNDDQWLSVPQADRLATSLGFEFVHYELIDTTEEAINAAIMADSVQAVRNGLGAGHMREGVVLHPPIEVTINGEGRIICKHKRPEFAEREHTPKFSDPDEIKALEDAKAISEEWVTSMRLQHVLDAFPEPKMEDATKIIKAMLEDVSREASGEIIESKAARKEIGKRTMKLFKEFLAAGTFN